MAAESDLLELARAGDEAAFEALFARYEPALLRRLRHWIPSNVRRKVSASDLLQETRIVACRRCGEFEVREGANFGQWLDRIARFKLKEALKRHVKAGKRDVRREVTRGARPDTGCVEAQEPTPSQVAIAAETAERVRRAFERLPEHYREVLRLVREERLLLRDVAERMGRSREAVKKLYGRALARFTELFES
jgi:RNA polymerase sigma-70 factor (subfamily 1)